MHDDFEDPPTLSDLVHHLGEIHAALNAIEQRTANVETAINRAALIVMLVLLFQTGAFDQIKTWLGL